MVNLGKYIFKDLNAKKITPVESFTDAYVEEVDESEHVCTATKKICLILDDKYKKSDSHKVMETQCQHLKMIQRNDLLKLLQRLEELFDVTLGTWKKYPEDFDLKEETKTIFWRPYPVPKLQEEMFKMEVERLVILGVLEAENDSEWGAHTLLNLNVNKI